MPKDKILDELRNFANQLNQKPEPRSDRPKYLFTIGQDEIFNKGTKKIEKNNQANIANIVNMNNFKKN